MKKLCLALLTICGLVLPSFSATYTTNLNLKKPAHGEDVNTWDETVNSNMDIIDAAVAIKPVDLNSEVTGILPSAHLVSTVAYTSKQNVWTDTNNFQIISASSASFVGPVNIANLTANQCVQTGAGGLLTTSGASCGGSGGSSALGVNQNGIQITSPTIALNALSPPFLLTAVGGGTTAQWALDGSSVTLKGNNVVFLQNTLQNGATFYVSSGTVSGQFSSNKVVTSTLSVAGDATIDAVRVTGVNGLTVDALTAGRCVETTTGGKLTVAGAACGTGTGGGGVVVPSTFTWGTVTLSTATASYISVSRSNIGDYNSVSSVSSSINLVPGSHIRGFSTTITGSTHTAEVVGNFTHASGTSTVSSTGIYGWSSAYGPIGYGGYFGAENATNNYGLFVNRGQSQFNSSATFNGSISANQGIVTSTITTSTMTVTGQVVLGDGTILRSTSTLGGGSAGGVSVYPASATASFPYGLTSSSGIFYTGTYPSLTGTTYLYAGGDQGTPFFNDATGLNITLSGGQASGSTYGIRSDCNVTGSPGGCYGGYFTSAGGKAMHLIGEAGIGDYGLYVERGKSVFKSSVTIENGLKVTQGIITSTIAITSLTNQSCIGTDSTGNTIAGTCGGGGGGSALAVTVGPVRSSPTTDVMFNPNQMSGVISGSTITISLQSSSVTLQGNLITFTGLQAQDAAIGLTTASLRTDLTAVGVATASLRSADIAIGVTTASLRTDMLAVGVATASLRTQLNTVGVDTQTLRTDLIAVGVATASLRTGLIAVGVTTASLRVDLTATALSTGTLLTQSSATATYLSQTVAAANYLLQSAAASTYLTQSSATVSYCHANGGNCTSTGGGGGGYAVEPATVTFNLAKGFTASTGTITGASGLSVTYGVTVGSLAVSGTGNLSFSNPGTGTYQVVGSSIDATIGSCAQFSSSWTIRPVTCGTGTGSADGFFAMQPTTATINISSGVVLSGSAGSSGQFLKSNGPGTVPTWAAPEGSGDAILASTQVWTGGNALYGSTTFYGEVYMVGKSTVSYTEVFIDASTATFSGPVSLTTASVSGSLYFPTGTTQYTTPEIYVLNADSTTSNLAGGVVYASSSPIMTNVISGATVYFDCFIVFQTTATANGIMLAMWTQGTSGEIINYTANIPTAADGTGGALQGWGTSNGDRITGTGVQAANTSYIARLFGYHLPKANGTLGVLFSGETIRSSATLKAGSMCEWKKGYR